MATTLNGVTLADPFDVQITRKTRGNSSRSANWTYNVDVYSSTPLREITLKWRLITVSQRNTILAQVSNATTTARTLILEDSDSINVYYDTNSETTETKVITGLGIRYNLEVRFTENV
jgi:hypothetical protein